MAASDAVAASINLTWGGARALMDGLEMLKNLQKMDIEAIAIKTVADNADTIEEFNIGQLSLGFRAGKGSPIRPSYKTSTIASKKGWSGLKGVTDHVTLYSDGDFYGGIYAAVKGTDIEYGSRDSKEEKLQEKYSTQRDSIFGLNKDSKESLIDGWLRPDWQEAITKATGLEFV